MDGREDITSSYLFLPEGGGEEVASPHQGQPSHGFPEGEGGSASMFCGKVAAYFFLLLEFFEERFGFSSKVRGDKRSW